MPAYMQILTCPVVQGVADDQYGQWEKLSKPFNFIYVENVRSFM